MRCFCLLILIFNSVVQSLFAQPSANTYDFSFYASMEVKSVEDFFDRFNFRKNTGFLKYLEKLNPGHQYTRKELLGMIFNRDDKSFDRQSYLRLIERVRRTSDPVFLRYSDPDWYAEVVLLVSRQGRLQEITLVLQVNRDDFGGYSWDIVSAFGNLLEMSNLKTDSLILATLDSVRPPVRDYEHFFSPVSHGIDFTNIDQLFTNYRNADSYLYPGKRTFELQKLVSLIVKKEIKFVQVMKIRYHLLQVEGFILMLEQFNRRHWNNGWLISNILPASNADKLMYKSTLLRLP